MSKIKVMHVLCMGTYSGAENVAITIIRNLKDMVDSVYVSPNGSIRKIVKENGILHYAIEKVDVKNIRRAIRDIRPDVIHAHDFMAGTISSLATRKIPIISHLHNNPPWIKGINARSVAYALSAFRYCKILTVSSAVKDEYIFGRLLASKTTVVGNPIDFSKIKEKAGEVNQSEKTDVLFLGRLMPQKNPLLFVDIIADLAKKRGDIKAAMVGDGDLREEVERKIAQYGLSDNVKLYGFQENPYIFVNNTKALCMPSTWEGFGLAAVEGLCLGRPVIAAPVGGLGDIVNEECGKLCVTKEDYVTELCKILDDPVYLTRKSEGALKRARDFDNINVYGKMIMDVYKKVTGGV